MAKRILETELVLSGKKEYLEGLSEVTAALKEACEAKERFDALFSDTSNRPGEN